MHNARNLSLAIGAIGALGAASAQGAPTQTQVLTEGLTRAQVGAETLRAIRDGEIRHGDSGLTDARQFSEVCAALRVRKQRCAMN